MPSINRLAVQNKSVPLRKNNKIPIFNSLNYPQISTGSYLLQQKRVLQTGSNPSNEPDNEQDSEPDSEPDNEPDNKPDSKPDSEPDNEPDQEPEYLSQINMMIYLQTGGEI